MTVQAVRLRPAGPELLGLPWLTPLGDWSADAVAFRELPIGPSRHLVRFVEADRTLYALKELPCRTARHEYGVLRHLEQAQLPAVRPVGLVEQDADTAVLVTEYLLHTWQFRRLFMRLPENLRRHRERLFDGMAGLLVELHRAGVYWGDCSLGNTLFRRDGQLLQAFMVDAETSEVHPSLSDGQRLADLEVMVENVAGDLADLAVRLGRGDEAIAEALEDAESVCEHYDDLWSELHREVVLRPGEREKVADRVRRLNDLGFDIDELMLERVAPGSEELRLRVAPAERRFHVGQLRALTGLEVGEGQSTILLGDLRAFQDRLDARGERLGERDAAMRWLRDVAEPGFARARAAMPAGSDPVQGFCDLLEVRWILSERAGYDVGDDVALEALAARRTPTESAAEMAVAEAGGDPGVPGDDPEAVRT